MNSFLSNIASLILAAAFLSEPLSAKSRTEIVDPEVAAELEYDSPEIEAEWAALPTRDGLTQSMPSTRRARDRWAEAVRASCPECKVIQVKDQYGNKAYKVTYPNTYSFMIMVDPGLVEIVPTHTPFSKFLKMEDKLQRDIVDNAKKIGLRPCREPGSCQVNLGIGSAFKFQVKKLVNFKIHTLNNPAVFESVLGKEDDMNAPQIADLSEKRERNFIKLLADVDANVVNDIETYVDRLHKEVYYATTWQTWRYNEPPEKYHALNVRSVKRESRERWRVEMRGLMLPDSMRDLNMMLGLLVANINYTNNVEGLIPYAPSKLPVMRQYYNYVSTAKQDWKEYQTLVPQRLLHYLQSFNLQNKLPFAPSCRLMKKAG